MKKYQRKDYVISLRITLKDFRRASKNAEFVKMKFSDYAREAILNYLPKKEGGIISTLRNKEICEQNTV